jgi:hypothetical protein
MEVVRPGIAKLIYWIYYNPAAFYQSCVFVAFPSLTAAVLVPVSYFLSQIFGALAVSLQTKNKLSQAVDFIRKFRGCSFHEVSLEPFWDYEAPDSAAARHGVSQDTTSPLAKRKVRAFVVGRTPGNPPPNAEVSYLSHDGGYIFLRNSPSSQKAIQKFTILHELGHTAGISQALVTERATAFSCALLLPWFFLFAPLSLSSVAAISLACAAQFAVRFHWDTGRSHFRFKMKLERAADLFALERLSRADLARLQELFQQHSLRDDSLGSNPLISEFRNRVRLAAIEHTMRTGTVPVMDTTPFRIGKRAFFANVVTCCALAAGGQSFHATRLSFAAILAVFIILTFFGNILNVLRLRSELDERLSESRGAAAGVSMVRNS